MKQFIERFEREVSEVIEKYNLLKKGDKVVVACSGGKDSTTVLYLLKKLGYDPEALIIDLHIGKYSDENLRNLKQFCSEHKIKLHVVSIREFFGCTPCYARSMLNSNGINLKNCSICGVMKRYILNKKAREIGAKKIATGHNLDDEAQTALMNLFTGNLQAGANAGPSTGKASNENFVQRIKPLFFTREDDVRKYSKLMGFPVIYDRCPCSLNSFRHFLRNSLNFFEDSCKDIKKNIVESFLSTSLALKELLPEAKNCSFCGEPSRNNRCSACAIISAIRQ